jgi:hypothetical protein
MATESLTHAVSIRYVFTFNFFVTRSSKVDPMLIYFNNIFRSYLSYCTPLLTNLAKIDCEVKNHMVAKFLNRSSPMNDDDVMFYVF